MTLATFKPQSPAIVATPESLLKNVVCTKSDFVYCVPSFVEVCLLHRKLVYAVP